MPNAATLAALRAEIRSHIHCDEAALARRLIEAADIGRPARARAQERAAAFVRSARADAARSGLVDKFLQEYGLSTAEGVTLMRLAEALLRTPDAATADALIKDKVEAGDWAAHKGKSPFPLVNFSTRALMLTAAWLDEVEAKDPTGKILKATKAILDRVGEPAIRAAVGQAMRIMGEHFVLGETIAEALRRGRSYAAKGYVFSYDMLGEAAHTAADAEEYFSDYLGAVAAVAAEARSESPEDNSGVSVKLSALHPRYEYAQQGRVMTELLGRLKTLALRARAANIGLNVDAEESFRLDLSLDLVEALMRDPDLAGWRGFGVVVQAYQRRAGFVIDWLAALARATGRRMMVRLVKGAYWDGEIKRAQTMGLQSYPVFTRKVLTDVSYQACARKLLAAADVLYPQFATHNALTVALVREMAGDLGDYEFQRLHGMGEALYDGLVREGVKSRIYAPVGGHRELLPYLVRRLLENGANSSFVNQLIDPDLSIDAVVADPVDEARALPCLVNPKIPAPRDLFGGERLAAAGLDPSEPAVAETLQAAVGPLGGAPLRARPLGAGVKGGGPVVEIRNPARRSEIVGLAETATAADIAAAAAAAEKGASAWGARSASARAEILDRAAASLEARAGEFHHLAVREAGKTIPDAIAEIREAVDFLRYYAREAERRERQGGAGRAPLGVVACISPWNFPLAIFLGQTAAALAAGNAVLAKPAEQTPLIAAEAVELLYEAGVPEDALFLLPGDGPSVGAPLVAHPAVKGVVFTGSTEVALAINRSLAESGKSRARLIAETGGINAMIVDSTALLEQAVADVLASAFQSAGQRCSACRIVAVQEDVADRFCDMLAGAMAELSVGDPSLLGTDVGPVIDEDARRSIETHVAEMERAARFIARAGREAADAPRSPMPANAGAEKPGAPKPRIGAVDAGPGPVERSSDLSDGVFVAPAAFEVARISDLRREVFGPVLHVVRFKGDRILELVDEINALGYGLTLGVHTRIDEVMNAIAARARVGNIYVNRNQIGAVVGVQPFGGEGLSGTGPKAGGPHYLDALAATPPVGDASALAFAETRLEAGADAAIRALARAAAAAALRTDRADWLAAAAGRARGPAASVLRRSSEFAAEAFARALDLPGPTGESNTLRLRPRGVIVCLGGGDASLAAQIARALAAGNGACGPGALFADIAAALAAAGAPGLAAPLALDPGRLPAALVAHEALAGVAFDGEGGREALARLLAGRRGPILPLLSAADPPARYAVERTLTINMTAAGGDVRLLSLTD